jgi:hypothetical protein
MSSHRRIPCRGGKLSGLQPSGGSGRAIELDGVYVRTTVGRSGFHINNREGITNVLFRGCNWFRLRMLPRVD